MQESNYRSAVKVLSWRATATLTTIIIVFVLTRRVVLSLSVGLLEIIIKSLFYYLHERLWNKVKWGRFKLEKTHEG